LAFSLAFCDMLAVWANSQATLAETTHPRTQQPGARRSRAKQGLLSSSGTSERLQCRRRGGAFIFSFWLFFMFGDRGLW
jgi:hypothetical protein